MQSEATTHGDSNLVVSELVSEKPELKTGTTMGMVELSDTPQNIAAKFNNYEELRSLILKESDFYEITGGPDKKVVGYGVGKTGLYKLGVAFNLSTLIVSEKKITKPDNPEYMAYQTTVQCSAPNGRLVMEVGFCDNTDMDRPNTSEHIIRAMAKTRATERAYTVMTGETGKKADYKKPKNTVTCKCTEGPKTKVDGTCKTCGAYSEDYIKGHPGEFK